MPDKETVKKLYALGKAQWYDPFKRFWNKAVASEAEEEFTRFLKSNLIHSTQILDLGCGTGLNLQKITSLGLPFKKYTGIDFSPDMLNIARKKFNGMPNGEFKEADITALNLSNKYDIVVCTWVLSHLDYSSLVVNNAQQFLVPKGKIFLIFFTKPKWYVNLWLFPLSRYLFKAKYVSDEEVAKFKNVKMIKSFTANMATVVEVGV